MGQPASDPVLARRSKQRSALALLMDHLPARIPPLALA